MKARTTPLGPMAVPGTYLHGCLLLLLSESPSHGYELAERLGGLGIGNVDMGTVYRALRRLSDDGFVDSTWEEPLAGPARRRYWVTPAGASSLDDCTSTVVATSRSLGAFLTRRRRLAGQGMAAAVNG